MCAMIDYAAVLDATMKAVDLMFDAKSADILRRRYVLRQTMREIGEAHGITKQAIDQKLQFLESDHPNAVLSSVARKASEQMHAKPAKPIGRVYFRRRVLTWLAESGYVVCRLCKVVMPQCKTHKGGHGLRQCRDCSKKAYIRWSSANRNKVKQNDKIRYWKDVERSRAYQREYWRKRKARDAGECAP